MKKSSALGLGLVGLVGLAGVVACGGSSEILSGDLGGALASSNDAASLRDGGVAPPVGTPNSPPPRDAGPLSLRDARPASILDLTGRWRASSEDPISVELEQGGVVLGGRACGVMMVVTPGQSLLEPGNPNCTTFMDGRVEGRRVQFRFTLSYPYPGISPIDYRVDAQISADGRSFEGDLEQYNQRLKRVTVNQVNWSRE